MDIDGSEEPKLLIFSPEMILNRTILLASFPLTYSALNLCTNLSINHIFNPHMHNTERDATVKLFFQTCHQDSRQHTSSFFPFIMNESTGIFPYHET